MPQPARVWVRVAIAELCCARGHHIWHRASADAGWQACGHAGCAELVYVVRVSPAEVRVTRITEAEKREIEGRFMRLGQVLEYLGIWATDPVAPSAA